MKLILVAVGRPKDKHLGLAIAEFEARAGRYFRYSAIEVPAAGGGSADASLVRSREGEAIRRRLPADLARWALTREGEPMDSRGLANELADLATYSHPGVAFLIGGAFGLDRVLIDECERRLSLSKLTLPHELARLVLAEQIYRAGTIIRGEPYHKGA